MLHNVCRARAMRRRSGRAGTVVVCLSAMALAACKTVAIPAADQTAPVVRMDIYGIDEPDATFLDFRDCCTLRRTVGLGDELTIVASAEDADSGIQSVEIVATVITECLVTRSYPGKGPVPGGPPEGTMVLRQTEQVLASSDGSGAANASAPETRLVNAKTRLVDLAPEACGPVTVSIREDPADPPLTATVAERATTFCGVRFFARGKNGVGGTHSTATALIVEGPPRSGAFPCRSVPF